MLSLIGLGLTPKQLTLEALHTIQTCTHVYVETYTSKYAHGEIGALEQMIGKKITPLNRRDVEESYARFLDEAANGHVGLLIFGNPLTATTHVTLLEAAKEKGVNTQIIPGISVFNYRGMSGLDEYRFGRTTTFVFPHEGHEPLSTFDMIVQNKKTGLHTHCLFDLHPEKQRFMSVDEAIGFLERAAGAREVSVHNWIAVGLAGLGNPLQKIRAGHLSELKKEKWNVFPQSLIVCGELTDYEREALHALAGLKG